MHRACLVGLRSFCAFVVPVSDSEEIGKSGVAWLEVGTGKKGRMIALLHPARRRSGGMRSPSRRQPTTTRAKHLAYLTPTSPKLPSQYYSIVHKYPCEQLKYE
jgi:hypothetical protein